MIYKNFYFKSKENKEIKFIINEKYLNEFDLNEISNIICQLSTEKCSDETNKIMIGEGVKWGEVLFSKNSFFFKSIYTRRHIFRDKPFSVITHILDILSYSENNEIKMPDLIGCFSMKTDEGWVWNGMITRNLEGYENLNESDYEYMKDAILYLASKGILNYDMHFGNIMKNSDNEWKIVDFDKCDINVNEKDAIITMTLNCIESMKNEEYISEMKKFLQNYMDL